MNWQVEPRSTASGSDLVTPRIPGDSAVQDVREVTRSLPLAVLRAQTDYGRIR